MSLGSKTPYFKGTSPRRFSSKLHLANNQIYSVTIFVFCIPNTITMIFPEVLTLSILNCEIHRVPKVVRGRVTKVADTELKLLIAHTIRPPSSIPGVGFKQKKNDDKSFT